MERSSPYFTAAITIHVNDCSFIYEILHDFLIHIHLSDPASCHYLGLGLAALSIFNYLPFQRRIDFPILAKEIYITFHIFFSGSTKLRILINGNYFLL